MHSIILATGYQELEFFVHGTKLSLCVVASFICEGEGTLVCVCALVCVSQVGGH